MDSRLVHIRDYFQRLGLDAEIGDIYFSLYTKGPQTISELSRNAGIERTRIYRLLETLQSSSLVEVETRYKRKILKAAPISNLEVLFSVKEQNILQLQRELPRMEQLLQENLAKTSGTKIQFYTGQDGAKQILWNETKAKSEVVAILYENMQIRTAEKFFDRWVERCNDRNMKFRGIVSDTFLKSQATWYATHTNERLHNWDARYIKSEDFAISHSTVIYDDVVAYYSWNDNEIYSIEICNQEIADTQLKLFEMLWEQADVLPDESVDA